MRWPFKAIKPAASGTPTADSLLRTAALLGMSHVTKDSPAFSTQAEIIEEIAMRVVALENK